MVIVLYYPQAGRGSTSPEQQSPASPGPGPDQSRQQAEFAIRCREFEIEIEKISSHVEHLESQNTVRVLKIFKKF